MPSSLFLILTFAIPSSGAAVILSVIIAKDVRIACSAKTSVSALKNFPSAISFAIINATFSLDISSCSSSLILWPTPFGPISPSTLSAISLAIGISTLKEGSKPFFLAS